MDLGLADDTALVTASSSGLGKASAKALCKEGADVVINGRDPDRLSAAVEDLREVAQGDVLGQQGDLTDPDDIETIVQRTVDEFGGLDHLVTNSGGPPSGPFLDTTDEEWYEAYDLLVMSVVRLVRESTPYLREDGGGSITSITSLSVREAIDNLVLSNSVRMSVIGLQKTLSTELAPEIRVNAVLPGTHETPRIEELIEQGIERGDSDSYQEGVEDWTSEMDLGRLSDPDEFGNVVTFLCSERAGDITGAAVDVDGGTSLSNI
jgi:NAD(P)-dependent dehydrogenase (short-subunit alcohol dehydrogenase family)